MQSCTLLACFPATLAHSQPCKRRRGLFAPVTAACATLAAVRSSIKAPWQPPTHRAQGPPQSRWTEPPDGHAAMVNQLEHKDQPAACVNALQERHRSEPLWLLCSSAAAACFPAEAWTRVMLLLCLCAFLQLPLSTAL